MYVFTQRLFQVPYEWLRLGAGGRPGGGRWCWLGSSCCRPRASAGLAGRTALWLAYPLLLWATGFLNDEEREAAGRVLSPAYVQGGSPAPA